MNGTKLPRTLGLMVKGLRFGVYESVLWFVVDERSTPERIGARVAELLGFGS